MRIITNKNGSSIIITFNTQTKFTFQTYEKFIKTAKYEKFHLEFNKKEKSHTRTINGIAQQRLRWEQRHTGPSKSTSHKTKPVSNAHRTRHKQTARQIYNSIRPTHGKCSVWRVEKTYVFTISIRFDCSYYYYHSDTHTPYSSFSALNWVHAKHFRVLIFFDLRFFFVFFFFSKIFFRRSFFSRRLFFFSTKLRYYAEPAPIQETKIECFLNQLKNWDISIAIRWKKTRLTITNVIPERHISLGTNNHWKLWFRLWRARAQQRKKIQSVLFTACCVCFFSLLFSCFVLFCCFLPLLCLNALIFLPRSWLTV